MSASDTTLFMTKFESWRRDRNLRVEDMASALGMERGSLYRLIHCRQWPRPEVLDRIHRYTDGHVTANDMVADWMALRNAPANADIEGMLS